MDASFKSQTSGITMQPPKNKPPAPPPGNITSDTRNVDFKLEKDATLESCSDYTSDTGPASTTNSSSQNSPTSKSKSSEQLHSPDQTSTSASSASATESDETSDEQSNEPMTRENYPLKPKLDDDRISLVSDLSTSKINSQSTVSAAMKQIPVVATKHDM